MKDRILQLITTSILVVAFSITGFAFSDTLDPATPAGSESPTQGDDRIRELKRAVVERLQVEHTFPSASGVYDGSTVGYHKLVRLPEQGSAPSTAASYGALYTKDTSGQPELFYREESDGDEVQITTAGALNVTLTPAASAAEVLTGTESAKYVAPSTMVSHEGVVKAWGVVTYSGGTPTLQDSYNITSISDTSTGILGVTIANDFSSANYVIGCTSLETGGQANICTASAQAAGTFTLQNREDGGTLRDADAIYFMTIGDQ